MTKNFVRTFLLIVCLLYSCNIFNPETVPSWYPKQIILTDDDFEQFSTTDNRFENDYGIELSGSIQSMDYKHLTDSDLSPALQICEFVDVDNYEEQFHIALKNFFDEWWRLVSIDRFKIDSISSKAYTSHKLFHQIYITNNVIPENVYRGSVGVYTDLSYNITRITSDVLPETRLPKNPIIPIDSALTLIDGKSYLFIGFAHSSLVLDGTINKDNINTSMLSAYLDEDDYYRLTWYFQTPSNLRGYDIYTMVDAMTGENVDCGFKYLGFY